MMRWGSEGGWELSEWMGLSDASDIGSDIMARHHGLIGDAVNHGVGEPRWGDGYMVICRRVYYMA